METFTQTLTPYDVFIGILHNFPKGKNKFTGSFNDIIDFAEEQSSKYSILNKFTRSELEGGLDVLYGASLLTWNTCSPNIKEFSSRAIEYSFENFTKKQLFGEQGLMELKDLSKKFLEKFG